MEIKIWIKIELRQSIIKIKVSHCLNEKLFSLKQKIFKILSFVDFSWIITIHFCVPIITNPCVAIITNINIKFKQHFYGHAKLMK